MALTTLIANLEAEIRHQTVNDKKYMVVPAVMMVEGVHTGNKGPVLYTGEELAKSAPAWNHKPVVVYHPKKGDSYTSAASVEVMEKSQVGFLMNTVYDSGKLKTEAWIDENRCLEVDARVVNDLRSKKKVEVSTGLFSDEGDAPGTWASTGETYVAEARNHRPDHLAILPDEVGACSIAKGAGLLANEQSLGDIQQAVSSALYTKFNRPGYSWNGWVEDVYPGSVVYYAGGKLYRLTWTSKDGVVTLAGEPVEVVRVVSYREASGTIVGNAAGEFRILSVKEIEMSAKKTKVDNLIANGWGEKDREWLMSLDEDRLDRMTPKPQPLPGNPAPLANTAPVQQPQAAPAPVTVNAYIASAPPEIQGILQGALAADKAQKDALIANIMASPNNAFSKEWLEHQGAQPNGLGVLQGLHKLSGVGQHQAGAPAPFMANAAPPPFAAPQVGGPLLNMAGSWLPGPIANAFNASQAEINSASLPIPGQE